MINVSVSKSADALNAITWSEFELLVGESFRLQGYKVIKAGGAGPDGGIDLIAVKGTEKFLDQCKQWKAFQVGVTTVRELYGVMAANGAAAGFVGTSGKFTEEATEFASGRNIQLIDGPRLFGLIAQVKAARRMMSEPPRHRAAPFTPPQLNDPMCPSCGSAMRKRLAKRGENAGNEFWGCSQYPGCKGTRSA